MKHKIIVSLSLLMVICFMFGTTGCGIDAAGGWNAGAGRKVVEIQTKYMVLEFPAEFKDSLKHEEYIGSERTDEAFYMVQGDVSTELFRICFGDHTVGTPIGYLHTDVGALPITVQVSGSPENMEEETENLYFGMMEGMNDVLNCIYREKRFSEHMDFHPGEQTKAAMKYWSVDLPEAIIWEEIIYDDIYQVNFYGDVAATRIKLYSVCVGDIEVENPLGTMEIDGEVKMVSIRIDGLDQLNMMSEEDQSIAYSMMDTVNDVVQEIVSSEYFTPIEVE